MLTILLVASLSTIDLDRVKKVESNGNANAVSPAGAVGHYQFMRETWKDCVKRMGESWDFDLARDPVVSRKVAEFYLNKRIPAMLRSYKIPVTDATILASYNAGIGTVKKAFGRSKKNWRSLLPKETRSYIVKVSS